MAVRGRKSAASLSVVAGSIDSRSGPPYSLTKREAAIWRRVVASESATFFKTAAVQELLAEFCRHADMAEFLSGWLARYRDGDLSDDDPPPLSFGKLLLSREREARAAAAMATRLRITNQARYQPSVAAVAAKHASPARKPWEAAS